MERGGAWDQEINHRLDQLFGIEKFHKEAISLSFDQKKMFFDHFKSHFKMIKEHLFLIKA